jgi:hypothetical protein
LGLLSQGMQGNTFATTSSWRRLCCGVCETWLNDSIPDSEILPVYNIFRKDRTNKIGGGVLVGIKSDLEASHRPDLERPNCELVVIQLKQTNSKPVTL